MAEGLTKSDFKIMEELGRGSYGVVYKVKYRGDNLFYVLKTIDLFLLSPKKQKAALHEAEILRQVDHPHIVRYYASFIEDNTLHILMEFVDGGDLQKAIKTQRDRHRLFSETKLWKLAYEICLAVQYLHGLHIIHRDIKPLNILLTHDKRVKIGDLGVSRLMSGEDVLRYTRVGTPLYLAPELVKQDVYDFKVDIWSIGCVIYTLAQQDTPFKGENLIALGQSIVSQTPKPLPHLYSNKFVDFIMRMLVKRPKDRPGINAVLDAIPIAIRETYSPVVRLQPPFRLIFPHLEGNGGMETKKVPQSTQRSNEDAVTLKTQGKGKQSLILPKFAEIRKPGLQSGEEDKEGELKPGDGTEPLSRPVVTWDAPRPHTSSSLVRLRTQPAPINTENLKPGTPTLKFPLTRFAMPLIYTHPESLRRGRHRMTVKDLTLM